MSNGNAVLKVLNPHGIIEPPKVVSLAPRVEDLSGKRIALIHNFKPGADIFLGALEEILREKYPDATYIKEYTVSVNLAKEPAYYDEVVGSCDAFILGSGD